MFFFCVPTSITEQLKVLVIVWAVVAPDGSISAFDHGQGTETYVSCRLWYGQPSLCGRPLTAPPSRGLCTLSTTGVVPNVAGTVFAFIG